MENDESQVKIAHVVASTGDDLALISQQKAMINAQYMQALDKIAQLNEHIENQQVLIDAYEKEREIKDTDK